MTEKMKQKGSLGSVAEDLFVELFCDTFGPEKSEFLFLQYPFTDIYGNRRSIDFALESENLKLAIEIDGETYHNPKKVSPNKYFDDLTKQNSLIYQNWKVYRWVYSQLKQHPEKVKDELRIFVGEIPNFKMLDDYLPKQKGKLIELREHQKAALSNLQTMRDQGESIALLYHATGVGKTVTAVSDAKQLGKRTLFLAHTKELITQPKTPLMIYGARLMPACMWRNRKIRMHMSSVVAFKVFPEIWTSSNQIISAMSSSTNAITERQIHIGRF